MKYFYFSAGIKVKKNKACKRNSGNYCKEKYSYFPPLEIQKGKWFEYVLYIYKGT